MATQAAAAGHTVELVSPTRLCLGAFTRHVQRVHRVPSFGREPAQWLEAVIQLLRSRRYDVLLPTQEQAAILCRDASRIRELGVGLAVPSFDSLLRVQDKAAQYVTLRDLSLPHPRTWIVRAPEGLSAIEPPVYLKAPIGTASNAVRLIESHAQLRAAAAELNFHNGIIAQQCLPGPLVIIQAVFEAGELVRSHANLRERNGSSGSACVKRSINLPEASELVRELGQQLSWHGALSLDAILTPTGPSCIDINPRLVEPGNAWRSGTDLVDALIAVSLRHAPEPSRPSSADVRTHQLLLAILGAAEGAHGRRRIGRELATCLLRRGPYSDSIEELTPMRGDPLAAAPVVAATLTTLVSPRTWRWFAGGAVSAYALTPEAWTKITDHH